MVTRSVLVALVLAATCSSLLPLEAVAASPDQLVYVTMGQTYTVGADGRGHREVTPSYPGPRRISESSWTRHARLIYATGTGWSSKPLHERWDLRTTDTSSGREAKVRAFDLCCRSVTIVQPVGAWMDPPVWSPGRTKIAFALWSCVSTFVWGVGCAPQSSIYTVDADGSDLTMLAGTIEGSDPVWSPDGKRIAFTRVGTVEVVDAATGALKGVVSPPGTLARDPVWSPDGTKIAFVSGGRVWVTKADGAGAKALPAESENKPSWSPDSRYLAYSDSGGAGVMTIGADGKGMKSLALPASRSEIGAPQWSPDGTRIAFMQIERYTPRRTHHDGSLWVVDSKAAGRTRRLATFWTSYPPPTFAWRPH